MPVAKFKLKCIGINRQMLLTVLIDTLQLGPWSGFRRKDRR